MISTAKNTLASVALISNYLTFGYYNKFTEKIPMERRRKAIDIVSKNCALLLKRLNFQVEYQYSRPDLFADGKAYFMVCNHMSYMDIIFLSVGRPAVFVTSVEMENTPFLGDMALLGGSYFVERRNRNRVPEEVKDLASILQSGLNVFVFPEGTSTNGMNILPFKKALFTAAVDAKVAVLPVCVRYEAIDGEDFGSKNHDRICWYDKMSFFPHFVQLMTMKSLKVTVNYLDPIPISEGMDRHQLAELSRQQIVKKYFENRTLS